MLSPGPRGDEIDYELSVAFWSTDAMRERHGRNAGCRTSGCRLLVYNKARVDVTEEAHSISHEVTEVPRFVR